MHGSNEARSGSWPETTGKNEAGELTIGQLSAVALAREFGTPLYVFDEQTLRNRARSIRHSFAAAYPRSRVVYAGKAYLSPSLMRILVSEEIGLDVVSGGEIYAGLLSGVDPASMIFHGNNKSRVELEEAISAGVGLIAVDNELEIALLQSIGAQLERTVQVVLRLNPGVDPHTHAKMRTGASDSKFGFPIADGQADRAADAIAETRWIELVGYHAHVGSQIFDPFLVEQTIDAMFAFAAGVHRRRGIAPAVMIPGGGFGVADDASGNDVPIATWASAAAIAVRRGSERYGFVEPELVVEPGRAIIGPAGVALYEVGARKSISGGRTYVSIDGGMADNIRPALYGARYAAELANRNADGEPLENVTVAGKYCESGDVLIENAVLPRLVPGDLLAVPMAGAYCLAMASNYNLSPRSAAVLVNEGHVRLIRRRESYKDMLRAEVIDDSGSMVSAGKSLSAQKGSL
jgi:diaminopimelate decarboxylase